MLLSRENMLITEKHPKRRRALSDVTKESIVANAEADATDFPLININAHDHQYSIRIAIPGWNWEDIRINLRGNYLFVRSDVQWDEEQEYMHQEFAMSDFEKTFELPRDVRKEGITADYKFGILTISIPRNENYRTSDEEERTIEIVA